MGYQLDDDVVHAYNGHSENLEHIIERKEGLFQPPLPFEQRHGDVHSAWVAKNCKSSNNREQIVQSMMNAGMKVHSFGGCFHNKDFPSGYKDTSENLLKLLSQYKFYLSFENSICRHYYTEKLFRCFEAGVVPILLGHPADIQYFLPHQVSKMSVSPPSFTIPLPRALFLSQRLKIDALHVTFSRQDAAIKLWEFPSIHDLVSYVLKVALDKDLFYKHIAWKNMSTASLSPEFLGYWGKVPASGDQR